MRQSILKMLDQGLSFDLRGKEYKIPYLGIALFVGVCVLAFFAFFYKEDPEIDRGLKAVAELIVFLLSVVAGMLLAPIKSSQENEKAGAGIATELLRLRGAMSSRQIELEGLLGEISPDAPESNSRFVAETVSLRIEQEIAFLSAAQRDLGTQFPRIEKVAPTFFQEIKANQERAREILEELEIEGEKDV